MTVNHSNAPPSAPSQGLYFGHVMHHRLRPFRHRFVYGVFSMLIDIDAIGAQARSLSLFSCNRFNLFSFHERDHGARDGASLRAHIEGLLREAGLHTPPRHIRLLCYPRILGYVFNPLSVYYCYDEQARLTALVYEVKNTFGEQHSYVAPLAAPVASRPARGPVRQTRDKLFHVSPFIPMQARYHFTLRPPAETFQISIHEADAEGDLLIATVNGRHRPLSDRTLALAAVRYPLMTVKVIAAIHFEALRLWIKGARFHAKPPSPEPASFPDRDRPLDDNECIRQAAE